MNKKIRKYIDYKRLVKFSQDLKIDDKYFLEIKKIYLEDNLKLVEKFDSLKEYKSKYLFEKWFSYITYVFWL